MILLQRGVPIHSTQFVDHSTGEKVVIFFLLFAGYVALRVYFKLKKEKRNRSED
jgi:hypothetical protein